MATVKIAAKENCTVGSTLSTSFLLRPSPFSDESMQTFVNGFGQKNWDECGEWKFEETLVEKETERMKKLNLGGALKLVFGPVCGDARVDFAMNNVKSTLDVSLVINATQAGQRKSADIVALNKLKLRQSALNKLATNKTYSRAKFIEQYGKYLIIGIENGGRLFYQTTVKTSTDVDKKKITGELKIALKQAGFEIGGAQAHGGYQNKNYQRSIAVETIKSIKPSYQSNLIKDIFILLEQLVKFGSRPNNSNDSDDVKSNINEDKKALVKRGVTVKAQIQHKLQEYFTKGKLEPVNYILIDLMTISCVSDAFEEIENKENDKAIRDDLALNEGKLRAFCRFSNELFPTLKSMKATLLRMKDELGYGQISNDLENTLSIWEIGLSDRIQEMELIVGPRVQQFAQKFYSLIESRKQENNDNNDNNENYSPRNNKFQKQIHLEFYQVRIITLQAEFNHEILQPCDQLMQQQIQAKTQISQNQNEHKETTYYSQQEGKVDVQEPQSGSNPSSNNDTKTAPVTHDSGENEVVKWCNDNGFGKFAAQIMEDYADSLQELAEADIDEIIKDVGIKKKLKGKFIVAMKRLKTMLAEQDSAPKEDGIDVVATIPAYEMDGDMGSDRRKKKEEETKSGDNGTNNNVDFSKCEHILLVGDTGVGKSSLIRLLTKNSNIKTAHSSDPNSCTKDITPFLMTNSNVGKNSIKSVIWDTQGTQDSEFKQECKIDDMLNQDNSILNDIQRKLYSLQATKVKIVWVVEPNIKAKKSLHYQATFINKLGHVNDNSDSIWQSVLIVVTQPTVNTTLTQCAQGAIAAINGVIDSSKSNPKYPQRIEGKNLIGYTNIDWFDKNDKQKIRNAATLYQTQTQLNQKMFHYYKSNEVETLVRQCLFNPQNEIICFNIKWRKDKCTKCGIEGDKRFLNDEKCHKEFTTTHKQGVVVKHLGIINKNLKSTHTGKLKLYHPENASNRYHPGTKNWTHSAHIGGTFHRANKMVNNENWIAKAGGGFIYVGSVATLGLSPLFNSAVSKSLGKCSYCARKMSSGGCMWVYDCCDNYDSHPGCKSFANNKIKYLCCKEEINQSEGGCHGYYMCCPDKKFEIGNNNSGGKPIGCAKKCSECGDVVVKSGNNNDSKENKCGFYWPCCNKTGKYGDQDDDSLHCYKVCNSCDREWGNSDGCNVLAEHEFVSLE